MSIDRFGAGPRQSLQCLHPLSASTVCCPTRRESRRRRKLDRRRDAESHQKNITKDLLRTLR